VIAVWNWTRGEGNTHEASSGLAPVELLIWTFNPDEAKGVWMASPSQALTHLHVTKWAKIGSRKPN